MLPNISPECVLSADWMSFGIRATYILRVLQDYRKKTKEALLRRVTYVERCAVTTRFYHRKQIPRTRLPANVRTTCHRALVKHIFPYLSLRCRHHNILRHFCNDGRLSRANREREIRGGESDRSFNPVPRKREPTRPARPWPTLLPTPGAHPYQSALLSGGRTCPVIRG